MQSPFFKAHKDDVTINRWAEDKAIDLLKGIVIQHPRQTEDEARATLQAKIKFALISAAQNHTGFFYDIEHSQLISPLTHEVIKTTE